MCPMRLFPAVLFGAAWLACTGAHAAPDTSRPAAPDAHCLDARQVAELHQADPRTLAVAEHAGRRFRLQLAQECLLHATPDRAQLLAPHGWVCDAAQAYVRVGQQHCAIARVTPLDARSYAELARRHSHDAIPTLQGVNVREARRRSFTGSANYCFHPGMLRAWSEDAHGLVVEVSPRHPGSHRHYRVELMDSCSELSGAPPIRFVSGMGLNAICGNPGDKLDILDEIGIAGASAGAGQDGDLTTTRGGRLSRMRQSCVVAAVYPRD
ncbi:hypothetical protein LL964_13540 [Xanthomonas melonis]|nr:hypothetical protein [Xanthomonas melonis]MCC4601023.1 hypothetical protein [Xanthomonas melonis]